MALLEALSSCKAGRFLAHWAGRLPVRAALLISSLYKHSAQLQRSLLSSFFELFFPFLDE